jgi:GT2 family glycosyltransferase
VRPFLAPLPEGPLVARERPGFSVVIAAHQMAELVGGAIESALSQTAQPFEIVVCDDGSTDGTEVAVAPYLDRVTYVRRERGGEAAAKNTGVRAATGEFVAFLDADDVYLPERLEALGELAVARPDLDIVLTDAYLEVDGERVRRCYEASWPFAADDQRLAIVQRNFLLGHAAVRRSRVLAVGGLDEELRLVADWDLWARLILAGSGAGLVDEPLSCYRVRADSQSSQRAAVHAEKVAVLEKILARDDLRPTEAAAASAVLARERRELPVAQAREALREGRPDARRRALAVALGPAQGPRSRAKALAAAIAPGKAGAMIRNQGSEVTAGIVLPPSSRPGRARRLAGRDR